MWWAGAVKKRLFLHIGSHKTATSFLQGSLSNSPAALADLGLLYPAAGRVYGGHFKLCWALKDRELADQPLDALPVWAEVMEEIDASPHPAALISAESLGWGLDPARLAVLAKRYQVQVIFYLRSPDSHLESFYNQIVKDFRTKEDRTIEGYVADEPLGLLDTTKLLAPWAEMFGRGAIKLRLFGNSFLPDGILADFLRTMGYTSCPAFNPPGEMVLHKVSLPPDALDYLRLSNAYLKEQKGHHDFVLRLIRLSQSRPEAFQDTRAGILSPRARHTIRARFRASQLQACQAYLGLARSPFPAAEAPDFPDCDNRLPEADARVMAKVAALIRGIA